jgi:uncharacterized protein (DUF427 family)
MLTPGPDHPISIEPGKTRWRAFFAGHVIADTDDALILKEADFPQAIYFPRDSVATEYMSQTDKTTQCPYKGEAGWFTILMDGHFAENAARSYEDPYEPAARLRDRIVFQTDQIEVYPVDDAAVNPHHHTDRDEPRHDRRDALVDQDRVGGADVDDVVQHTDSGSGASQRDRWDPNVNKPDGGLR